MLTVLPMKDRKAETDILENISQAGENSQVLLMKDGDETLGWVAIDIKDRVLYLLRLSAGGYDFSGKPSAETIFILDTLVRSAASYAEDRGAVSIETTFPDFYDFFKLRGFTTDESHAFTPMSTIVRYG